MPKLYLIACAALFAVGVVASPVYAGGDPKDHSHDDHGTKKQHNGENGAKHGGHGSHGHGAHAHHMDPAVGEAGNTADVGRTFSVTMKDNEYEPASITVETGETVRFVVVNAGELVHEFNIGTAEMHKAHQAEMMGMMETGALEADRIVHAKMGDMKHDDPNSVLLEPGQEGEVIWKFGQSGEIEFACNVPGHYESGMVGRFHIH